MRAKVWTHRRRIDALERSRVATTPSPVPADEPEAVE
jgi:hypothetical protein